MEKVRFDYGYVIFAWIASMFIAMAFVIPIPIYEVLVGLVWVWLVLWVVDFTLIFVYDGRVVYLTGFDAVLYKTITWTTELVILASMIVGLANMLVNNIIIRTALFACWVWLVYVMLVGAYLGIKHLFDKKDVWL